MQFDVYSRKFINPADQPNKLAIVGSNGELTWSDLQNKVQLATELIKKLEIPVGHPVVIFGHKEVNYMVWEIACVISKVPFIPFDSIYPIERLNTIIEETNSQILVNLSGEKIESKCSIEIDNSFRILKKRTAIFDNAIYGDSEDPLMYMIFTSGSTGKPKGVMVNHSSYCELIKWMDTDYGFNSTDVFMNQAVFSFDLSLYDCFYALHVGGTLLAIDRDLSKDYDRLLLHLKKHNCSVWTSTPSTAFIYIQSELFNDQELQSLKTFLFIGEALPDKTIGAIEKRFENAKCYNAYGPTEACVATTLTEVSTQIISKYKEVPIGESKPNGEIKILDKDENGIGEILIVGNHVAKGYFKNPELTNQKFIEHEGQKAFKTGDLGCFKNNMLLFRGRNDDQVKLRGYRIELGEISAKVAELSFIKHAEAIALQRKNVVKKIVCFVELKNGLSFEDLRLKCCRELDEKLPDYMIPNDFREIDSWPLNANQKIDRKKLVELYLKR
jgi:D-alanine--poly(phosphoribitol) ligase subunit 1